MKNVFLKLSIGVILAITLTHLSGCSTMTVVHGEVLDAAEEFADNMENGDPPFYSIGSLTHGYRYPGVDEERYNYWVVQRDYPTKIRFMGPRGSLFGWTEEDWDKVDKFLLEYNTLVLQRLEASS